MVFPSHEQLAIRLVVAALLGAAVGLERELRDHPAGLRTHLTVALGSALFAIVSAYGFEEFDGVEGPYQVDVTRVASNVVTGVGFLGGGTILKHGVSVRGLTTAASLWVTAAVGLAVGLGQFTVAGITSLTLLATLLGLRPVVQFVSRRYAHNQTLLLVRTTRDGDLIETIRSVRALEDVKIRSMKVNRDDDGGAVVEVDARTSPGTDRDHIVETLLSKSSVSAVELV